MKENQGSVPQSTKVRAPRYDTNGELIVASKTIGTDLTYRLCTENVSRSGLLLTWDYNTKIPFIEKTILELTIDPESDWLSAPVSCLGKVVRRQTKRVDQNVEATQFGIRIVQIDNTDLDIWDDCISHLAENAAQFVTKKEQPMLKTAVNDSKAGVVPILSLS